MQFDLYRQSFSIEGLVTEKAWAEITDVETEALHHVVNNGWRVDCHNLVGDIRREIVHAQVFYQFNFG